MPHVILAVVASTFLSALASQAEPALPGPKIELPDVEGFTRSKIRAYQETGLGYSVAYSTPAITVTLYVYNRNLNTIPDGPKSQIVQDELKQTTIDIDEAKRGGHYKSVKQVGGEEIVSLGKGRDAPTARRRQFLVELTKNGEKLSDAYVTGYKDHFIKLRITYDLEGKAESEKKIATLLDAIASALK
jgi:hypothetical protein